MISPQQSIADVCFTAIDFESAGAGRADLPVQIGLSQWSCSSGHAASFVSYLHHPQGPSLQAQRIHGIGVAQTRSAPALRELWPMLQGMLRMGAVVAHGKGTEKRFLRCFPGHGFGPWVDTLLLARAAWPDLPSHALGDVCDHCELTPLIQERCPQRQWHDALFDATASLFLLEHLIRTLRLQDLELAVLLQPRRR